MNRAFEIESVHIALMAARKKEPSEITLPTKLG
jgi:hypothetical protein